MTRQCLEIQKGILKLQNTVFVAVDKCCWVAFFLGLLLCCWFFKFLFLRKTPQCQSINCVNCNQLEFTTTRLIQSHSLTVSNKWGQCPILALSVCGPQMVWEWVCVCVCVCIHCVCVFVCVYVCVCVCGWNELEVCTTLTYPHIYYYINYQFIPYYNYASMVHKLSSTHRHPQTIWGQRTDGAKRG